MDAAQMLTAHEIARQCEHMARIVEQRRTEPDPLPGSTGGRHLRLADPVTQPIERITEPAEGGGSGRTGTDLAGRRRAEELTSREWGILAFERQWWKRSGSKERAIRELFDMSQTRYYQVLNTLLEKPAAQRADPMLVKRLRRVRSTRQSTRDARMDATDPTRGTDY